MDQNYDSSSTMSNTTGPSFINLFSNEINKQDVNGLLNAQISLLEQLEKTSEKLDGINRISSERYLEASKEFTNHTQLLISMKKDLDFIFKRIKLLKARLSKKYPEVYASVLETNAKYSSSIDDDDDDNSLSSASKPISNSSLVKSKTVDGSQLSTSMRETFSIAQFSDNSADSSPSSFDAVRRFVFNKSPGGNEITALLKSARNELRKFNEGFLGGNNQKQSISQNDE